MNVTKEGETVIIPISVMFNPLKPNIKFSFVFLYLFFTEELGEFYIKISSKFKKRNWMLITLKDKRVEVQDHI